MVVSQVTATYHADAATRVPLIDELLIRNCLLRACVKGSWCLKMCASKLSVSKKENLAKHRVCLLGHNGNKGCSVQGEERQNKRHVLQSPVTFTHQRCLQKHKLQ